MSKRPGPHSLSRRRVELLLTLLPPLVLICVIIGIANRVAAVAAGLVLVVLYAALIVRWRRPNRPRREIKVEGPVFEGNLDFNCLPGHWRELGRETMGPANQRILAMPVMVSVSDGYLVIERKITRLLSKHPFVARADLRAVRSVEVLEPHIFLSGSSIRFHLLSGREVPIDLFASKETAEAIAQHFRDAIRQGPDRTTPYKKGLEVTSPPPPIRTSNFYAFLESAAAMLVFLPAMAGAHNGPFAAFAVLGVFIFALLGMLVRPRWLPWAVAVGFALVGLGFGVDALRLGQLFRLAGSVPCFAFAVWLARQRAVGATLTPSE